MFPVIGTVIWIIAFLVSCFVSKLLVSQWSIERRDRGDIPTDFEGKFFQFLLIVFLTVIFGIFFNVLLVLIGITLF